MTTPTKPMGREEWKEQRGSAEDRLKSMRSDKFEWLASACCSSDAARNAFTRGRLGEMNDWE